MLWYLSLSESVIRIENLNHVFDVTPIFLGKTSEA